VPLLELEELAGAARGLAERDQVRVADRGGQRLQIVGAVAGLGAGEWGGRGAQPGDDVGGDRPIDAGAQVDRAVGVAGDHLRLCHHAGADDLELVAAGGRQAEGGDAVGGDVDGRRCRPRTC
jgi:hypothetical protein